MKIIKIYNWMPSHASFQTEFLRENKLFPQGKNTSVSVT